MGTKLINAHDKRAERHKVGIGLCMSEAGSDGVDKTCLLNFSQNKGVDNVYLMVSHPTSKMKATEGKLFIDH